MPSVRSIGARANGLNVLFIAVDDLRPELGCYGHPMVKSPNIDKLAASGMLFTRTYCQQAVCAPSRSSLLSGCRPDTTKIYDLYTPLRKAMPDILSLPQHFKNSGYRTITLGKIYHHRGDDKIGWSEQPRTGGRQYCLPENLAYMGRRTAEARKLGIKDPIKFYNYSRPPATEIADVADNAYHDGAMTDVAVEVLRKHKGKPFFLAVGFVKPHLPFNAPKKYWDLYDRSAIPMPDPNEPVDVPRYALTNWGELRAYSDMPEKGDLDEAQTRRLIHGYYACVSFVDAQIGRLLDALDRLNLRDNTVIILWGDHGWKLGDYGDWCKHTNFELDTHVPMILSAPDFAGGRKCHALTEFVDIYPTLAELCGLDVPKHCEGDSMVPLLRDPNRQWKSAAFSQYPRGRNIMGYSVRTDRWRYAEWRNRKTDEVVARELYDHSNDPFAHANVVDKPEHLPLVNGLAAKLRGGWKTARPPAG
jgi:arylsulfatase A-like enzyme